MPNTVLVVDDHRGVRKLVRHLLEPFGLTVREAASGQEAVEEYERHGGSIGVVVSDFSMPGMNGLETLAALRKMNPHVRAFLFTAEGDLSADSALPAAERVFRKPDELGELVEAVTTAALTADGPRPR